MRYFERLGVRVGVTAALALMLGAVFWPDSAEATTGRSPALEVPAATGVAFSAPTIIPLQPTLQQRRGRGGSRQVAPRGGGRGGGGRGGGGRVAVPRGRGGRPVGVRGGRYYAPYYGYGYGYGYGYPYPYYGGGYYGAYGGSYSYTGSVRLKVKPRIAEVLVDGYFVGIVDDFDGALQRLKLEPGPKHIEIRSPGFQSLSLDVRILPGRKITYEANMLAGDPGPAPQPPPAVRRAPPRPRDTGVVARPPEPRDADVGVPTATQAPPPGYEQAPPAFGGVRLRVRPREAQVFVDGYFVGKVDDFDGGKGLPLESGPQSIEIRADGYETLQIRIRILPDDTITYEGDLTPLPGR